MSECATEGCAGTPIAIFERGGVVSTYCKSCMIKIEAMKLRGRRFYYPEKRRIKAIDEFESGGSI